MTPNERARMYLADQSDWQSDATDIEQLTSIIQDAVDDSRNMKRVQMRLWGKNIETEFDVPHVEKGMIIEWSRDLNYVVDSISVQGNASIIILNVLGRGKL